MRTRPLGRFLALSLLVLSLPLPVQAQDIFFSQPVVTPAGGFADGYYATFGGSGNPVPPQQEADNFIFSRPVAINFASWWGAYFNLNGGTQPDNFTLRFFADVAGNPAPVPFFQATPTVTRTDTGFQDFFGDEIFFYTASFPAVEFPSDTTFYFSTTNGVAAPNFIWNTSNLLGSGGTHWTRLMDADPWQLSVFDEDLAFQLGGFLVPEPSTLAIVGLSSLVLLGAGFRRWRMLSSANGAPLGQVSLAARRG